MQFLYELFSKEDIAKEILSFVFGLLATSIGFFLALYFNQKVENKKELETFSNIKRGIVAEIKQNEHTIENSFKKYIEEIIFNELSTASSNQQLTNAMFLKYANHDLLIMLQNYIRKCDLCNKQKNQLKEFRISGAKEQWEVVLKDNLKETIAGTESAMMDLNKQFSSL